MQQQLKLRIVFDVKHVATLSTDPNPRPGLIQLEARIGTRKVYRAIAKVYADQFGKYNRKTRTTTGETVHNRADAERINRQIQDLREEIQTDFYRCQRLGLTYSLDRITATTSPDLFLPWASQYVANMPVSESTRQSKTTHLKTIAESGIFSTFSDLTHANILAFDAYLRRHIRRHTQRPLTPGYIHNVHAFLHTLSTAAITDGRLTSDPYKDFRNPKAKPSPRPYLTPEQIAIIAEAPCINTPENHIDLRDARDLFLLQIHTGLAYIDVQRAPWLTARPTGVLQGTRQKTKTAYMIRISAPARAILDRWDWRPPRISSVALNEALQLIVCQAITGLAQIGVRNLHNLPPSVIDLIRHSNQTPTSSAQTSHDDARLALLLMYDNRLTFEALRRSGKAPNMTRATLTNTLRRLISSTAIPSLSTHIGRHTFGTLAINAGVPVAVLQRIMGHTNPATTLLYAKLQPSTITSAFDVIDSAIDPNKKI